MPLDVALRALARASVYEAGRIIGPDEATARVREQREAAQALGLAVPGQVTIREVSEARTERRWEGG